MLQSTGSQRVKTRLSGCTDLNPPGTCANPALGQQMAWVLRKRDPAHLLCFSCKAPPSVCRLPFCLSCCFKTRETLTGIPHGGKHPALLVLARPQSAGPNESFLSFMQDRDTAGPARGSPLCWTRDALCRDEGREPSPGGEGMKGVKNRHPLLKY